MKKFIIGFLLTVAIVALCVGLFIFSPYIRRFVNDVNYKVEKVDEQTNYKLLKEVEDTCRAMIASYESDKLIFEQFVTSKSEQKIDWAYEAKIRANSTAVKYNEYILKNSYVWANNIPYDIRERLEIIGGNDD